MVAILEISNKQTLVSIDFTKHPKEFKDQLGISFQLKNYPKRIISLVPSITLTLFDLGLGEAIVGRTKFCIHPKQLVKSIPKIGGTKQLNLERIKSLKPDLIIANKEENEKSQIESLSKEFPTWISDVNDLESNYSFIKQISEITNTVSKGNEIVSKTQHNFKQLADFKGKKVVYLIWKSPYMVAANNTFINSILTLLNLNNVYAASNSRYPSITLKVIEKIKPELIFLSSEPYPFKIRHIQEFKSVVPSAKVMLVDGEYFSWFGSKMQNAPKYFEEVYKLSSK